MAARVEIVDDLGSYKEDMALINACKWLGGIRQEIRQDLICCECFKEYRGCGVQMIQEEERIIK